MFGYIKWGLKSIWLWIKNNHIRAWIRYNIDDMKSMDDYEKQEIGTLISTVDNIIMSIVLGSIFGAHYTSLNIGFMVFTISLITYGIVGLLIYGYGKFMEEKRKIAEAI